MHNRYARFGTASCRVLFSLMGCGFLVPVVASASDLPAADPTHAEHHHEHGAHVHGASQLNIAVDGPHLGLQWQGALHNFVGFEHAPETTEERTALIAVQTDLQTAAGLVLPSAAGCELASKHIVVAHLDVTPEADTPANVNAEWQFDCTHPEAITTLDFAAWFARFPLTEEIEVQWIRADGQGGSELTPADSTLSFAP